MHSVLAFRSDVGDQSENVTQRFHLIVVLSLGCLAAGCHWDALQTVGWARMFLRYAATMPVTEAAKRTLNGEMCGVCEVVSHGKQAKPAVVPLGELGAGKSPLILEAVPRYVFATPGAGRWSWENWHPPGADRDVPPTPPPRAA